MGLTCALVSHIYMWAISKNILSEELIVEILHRADYLISSDDLEKHVFVDKDFFSNNGDESNNLDILNKIHKAVWLKISEFLSYREPVVDHAVLLFKKPGGVETEWHQDRAYWATRDEDASIFSVWIALEDITEERGALNLVKSNEVSMSEIGNFNNGKLIEHELIEDKKGGFPLLIRSELIPKIESDVEVVNLKRGSAVLFDSFEPHMSRENSSLTPRLAMKIAYSERVQKDYFLISVNDLEKNTNRLR